MSVINALKATIARQHPTLRRLCPSGQAAAGWAVVAAACGTGCGHTPPAPAAARHLYVGLDVSGSAQGQKADFLAATVGVAEGLSPDDDKVTLLRLDRDTREFYDDPVRDTSLFATVLAEETTRPNPQSRTLPAPFWQAVAERAEADGGAVWVCLLSDGDNDDLRPASWDDMARAAARLARNPHVRAVVIAGARPENWAQLRQCFGPLGARLHLLPPGQVKTDPLAASLGLP